MIVVGGGDTGSDCVGTSIRQQAVSVTQLEILPRPPDGYNPETPWPFWPKIMRTSSSQEEGCQRRWSTLTKALDGGGRPRGRIARLRGRVDRRREGLGDAELPGTDFTLPADLVLIAMGFVHVVHAGMVAELGREARRPRQRGGRSLDDQRAGRFCRRRHGPRGVAGGSRHQPGPPLRRRLRQVAARERVSCRKGHGWTRTNTDRRCPSVVIGVHPWLRSTIERTFLSFLSCRVSGCAA